MEVITTYTSTMTKKQRLDRIKSDAILSKAGVARQLTEIHSDTKARRDAGNQAQPDMSVFRVIF